MAVYPACLHHCHSFTLATLSLISVHTSGRNTCRPDFWKSFFFPGANYARSSAPHECTCIFNSCLHWLHTVLNPNFARRRAVLNFSWSWGYSVVFVKLRASNCSAKCLYFATETNQSLQRVGVRQQEELLWYPTSRPFKITSLEGDDINKRESRLKKPGQERYCKISTWWLMWLSDHSVTKGFRPTHLQVTSGSGMDQHQHWR